MSKLSSFIVLILISTSLYSQNNRGSEAVIENIQKISKALVYIDKYYVDTINISKIVDKTISDMLDQLDPHSTYIPAEMVSEMNEPLEGSFNGIGIEFIIVKDTLTVQAPVFGGPSALVGILAGDKIVSVDGENIAGVGISNDKIFKYLRGPKGTKVELKILRQKVSDTLDFVVTRDKIPLNSLDAYYEAAPGVLYMKLGKFAITSPSEIIDAFISMHKYPRGVILDLRGNGGGFLGVSLMISNFFLQKDEMILYTEGLNSPKKEEYANGRGVYQKGPLVVLIDENSASASEIVAGALQDWDRAVIIGRKSFGKGLVQQMMPLDGGSQMRLTVARYHTPSGRVIQSPYKLGDKKEYYKAFLSRYENGEFYNKDSINFPDSLKYKTLKKGRVVYGGGGIMPDIFVPQDTSYFSEYYARIIRMGVFNEYMNIYCDRNRLSFKEKYPDFDTFFKEFNVDQQMFSELIEYSKQSGINPVIEQIEKSKSMMELQMKALVARSIFGMDSYYKVLNNVNNEAYNKAMYVIENWSEIFDKI